MERLKPVRALSSPSVEFAAEQAPSLSGPNWLTIGADGGVVVQLFISQGVNIAIRVEQAEGGRDVDVDSEESVHGTP